MLDELKDKVVEVQDNMLKNLLGDLDGNVEGMEDATITEQNYIAIISEDCKVRYLSNNACAAGLLEGYNTEWATNNTPVVIVSALMHGEDGRYLQNTEVGLRFLDWLLNRSPYACTFISKNSKEVVDSGFVLCDPDTNRDLMVGGLVACRVMWEYTSACEGWYELVSRGCNENLAFLVSHRANFTGGRVNFDNRDDCHRAVSIYYLGHAIRNFVFGKPDKRPTYKDKPGYGGISNLWGKYEWDKGYIKDLTSKINYSEESNNNIFAKDPAKKMCSVKNGFDQLAPLVLEYERTVLKLNKEEAA